MPYQPLPRHQGVVSVYQGVASVEVCFQIYPDTYNVAKIDEVNIGYFGGSHLPYFSQITGINVRRNTDILIQRRGEHSRKLIRNFSFVYL